MLPRHPVHAKALREPTELPLPTIVKCHGVFKHKYTCKRETFTFHIQIFCAEIVAVRFQKASSACLKKRQSKILKRKGTPLVEKWRKSLQYKTQGRTIMKGFEQKKAEAEGEHEFAEPAMSTNSWSLNGSESVKPRHFTGCKVIVP